MCGILGVAGSVDVRDFNDGMERLAPRGPDCTKIVSKKNVMLGFKRLAINGSSSDSMQPFSSDGVHIICNGEIFNHTKIENEIEFSPKSGSDCECLVGGFQYWNFPTLCSKLDAEFAMIAYDEHSERMWVARDPYGVRPLFWGTTPNGTYVFSSELKGMYKMCTIVNQFTPGWYMCVSTDNNPKMVAYSPYIHTMTYEQTSWMDTDIATGVVKKLLIKSVEKRMMCEQGGVCCLLSGGLDSSLVAAIASTISELPISTYSIGMEGSPDLTMAKKVAGHIGSVHTTVCYPPEVFLEAIPEVIKSIESYDVTTVRASVGNWLIGRFIKRNSGFKVVLNGDYADEVCGGYLYTKLAPTRKEFYNECKRLVQNIQYFDSLRSDRSICAHGLEARAPYADKDFLEFYMKLHPDVTSPEGEMEKFLLRKAFDDDPDFLPVDILWRSKEAFSDGVSSQGKSWYQIIQDHVAKLGYESEEEYYKSIFDEWYGQKHRNVIPYKWMPKFCDATDPSARTLKIYNRSS